MLSLLLRKAGAVADQCESSLLSIALLKSGSPPKLLLYTIAFLILACSAPARKDSNAEATDSAKEKARKDSIELAASSESGGAKTGSEDWEDFHEVTQGIVTRHYQGSMNAVEACMNLSINNTLVTGYYRYQNYREGLYLKGTLDPDSGTFSLRESVRSGDQWKTIGFLEGVIHADSILGTWFNNQERTKTFTFALGTADISQTFNFQVHYSELLPEAFIKDIFVLDSMVNVIQELRDIQSYDRNGRHDLFLEDLNFDHHPDLRILAIQGNDNITYTCWLFDPRQKRFVPSPECSAIPDPMVDICRNQLISNFVISTEKRGVDKYVYRNGHFYLIERELLENDQRTVTRYTIEGGKSVPVAAN